MSDQNAPYPWPQGHAAPEASPVAGTPTRFVDQALSEPPTTDEPVRGQRGLGPFTLREWFVIALGTALVVLSFFSLFSGAIGGGYAPVWSFGIAWIGAVGLPLAAVVLIVLRRMLPRFRNVGGLSIDQAASVAFSVAAFVWLDIGIILTQMSAGIGEIVSQFAGGLPFNVGSVFGVGAIVWISFVVALAGVFFTVFARFVPPFAEDFVGREEVPAHATARPVRPILATPRPQPAQASWPAAAPGMADGSLYSQQPGDGAPHAWQQAPGAYGVPRPHAHEPSGQHTGASFSAQDPFGQQPSPAQAPFAASAPEARPSEQRTDTVGATPAVQEPAGTQEDGAAAPSPEPEQTAMAAEQVPGDAAGGVDQIAPETTSIASVDPMTDAPRDEAPQQEPVPAPQPFWALAPVERDVHDFEGRPIFRIGPTAWALVLEDRSSYFVMRHDDGRIGYLHDTTGVTRG